MYQSLLGTVGNKNDEIVFVDNSILYWVPVILVKSIYEQMKLCRPDYGVHRIIGGPDYQGISVCSYIVWLA